MSFDIVATKEMVICCFDSIISYLNKKHIPKLQIPREWSEIKCPLFVTWTTGEEKSLRGCIGTFSQDIKLDYALRSFAQKSAFTDHRFSPVKMEEIKTLNGSVSLLIKFEKCKNIYDWKVGKHGIEIEFRERGTSISRQATYLPEYV